MVDKPRTTPAMLRPEKPWHRFDKSWTTPATKASPKYAQNNTKYKHKHLRKLDKRSKQKERRANSSNQEKARTNSGQTETKIEWREQSSCTDQAKEGQATCIAHNGVSSAKNMDQKAEDPERMNQHTKPRTWRDKEGPKPEPSNFQLHRTISSKFSNPSSCKNFLIHMNNFPLGNNKNINIKTHNRDNHYENSQLIRKNNAEKARLAKKRIRKIIDLKTCRQKSKRDITLN